MGTSSSATTATTVAHWRDGLSRVVTKSKDLARSPGVRRVMGAVIITGTAGVALTPLGEIDLLPATVAAAALLAIAALAWMGGYLAGRVGLRVICGGLLTAGTLAAIDGISLLTANSDALRRSALAGSLWLSVISALLCLNIWEELALQFRLDHGRLMRHTATTIFWNLVFSGVVVTIVISPFVFPAVLTSSYTFLLFRLVPIVPGVAIGVTLLSRSRGGDGALSALGEPIAWFCIAAQFSLMLSLQPLSLAWSAALALTVTQVVITVSWLIGYQFERQKRLEQTADQLREQVAALRAMPEVRPPIALPWMELLDHDIKHTLGILTLGSSHLRQVLGEEAEDGLSKLAGNMAASCNRLDRFINLFLDYAKYHDDAPLILSPKVTRVRPMVRSVAEDEALLGTHPVAVYFTPPEGSVGLPITESATMFWDQPRIEELLMNLIDNARKYSPRGTTVEVRAWLTSSGDLVSLRVSDRGRGMTRDEQAHAFEPYFRAPDAHGPGGRGLGLTMARTIAQRHEGRLELRSAPGVGTSVTVLLPLAVSPGADSRPLSSVTSANVRQ